MKKKTLCAALAILLLLCAACGQKTKALSDGTYRIEAALTGGTGRATISSPLKLTVRDGQMTVHIVLVSKSYVNLFPGTAEDAQKEGAVLLQPTIDTVDYKDGTAPEEVHSYDVPVPVIGEEFDLATLGSKGKWYDHKVIVTDPEPQA